MITITISITITSYHDYDYDYDYSVQRISISPAFRKWVRETRRKAERSNSQARLLALFIIREVNSDMPIYILNRTNARKKSDAPSGIWTHDTPISWQVL